MAVGESGKTGCDGSAQRRSRSSPTIPAGPRSTRVKSGISCPASPRAASFVSSTWACRRRGLAAKPVVDILVGVADVEVVREQVVPVLEGQGYEYFWRPFKGDDGPPFYPWFIKRDASGCRTHHIHVVEMWWQKVWDWTLFRDYLRAHPEAVAAYAELKRRLAEQFQGDRARYTEEKTVFITEVTERARRAQGRVTRCLPAAAVPVLGFLGAWRLLVGGPFVSPLRPAHAPPRRGRPAGAVPALPAPEGRRGWCPEPTIWCAAACTVSR